MPKCIGVFPLHGPRRPLSGLAQHLTGFGVEGGVQRERTVTKVLEAMPLGLPGDSATAAWVGDDLDRLAAVAHNARPGTSTSGADWTRRAGGQCGLCFSVGQSASCTRKSHPSCVSVGPQ